jgi:NAD-dependent deacetylase
MSPIAVLRGKPPAYYTDAVSRVACLPVGPHDRVFVLTGAGISAESGIRTFRDSGGLWEKYRFEEVASPEGWAAHPEAVWRFYAQRRAQAATCQPNAAHLALAALERELGDRLFLCTQNVDDLHPRAGSTRVHAMHGELFKSRCESSGTASAAGAGPRAAQARCERPPFEDRTAHDAIPRCACGARVRPHIVWFGEVPLGMGIIADALDRADLFVTIGSSGAVYPAAGFVAAVRGRARTVYVGPERPDNADAFDECRLGTAVEIVPTLFDVR